MQDPLPPTLECAFNILHQVECALWQTLTLEPSRYDLGRFWQEQNCSESPARKLLTKRQLPWRLESHLYSAMAVHFRADVVGLRH